MIATSFRYIVRDPGIRSGHACLEGTRIGVHDVIGLLLNGETNDTVLHCFPGVTKAQVYECLFDGDKLAGFTLACDFSPGTDASMLAKAVQLFGDKYDSTEWEVPPTKIYKWNDHGRTIVLRVPKIEKTDKQTLYRLTFVIISDDFVNNLAIQTQTVMPIELLIEEQQGRIREKLLDTGRSSAPYISDFVQLFPAAEVKYSNFGPKTALGYNGLGYDVEVNLYERYELTMQQPVVYNSAGDKMIGYGEPKFYLWEVEKVEGGAETLNPSSEFDFGPTEWTKIVANGGNFAAIGYTMIKDKPVPGFKKLYSQGKP